MMLSERSFIDPTLKQANKERKHLNTVSYSSFEYNVSMFNHCVLSGFFFAWRHVRCDIVNVDHNKSTHSQTLF